MDSFVFVWKLGMPLTGFTSGPNVRTDFPSVSLGIATFWVTLSLD